MQSKVLSRIMGDFLGKQRLPMVILDSPAVVKNRAMFSARGAGILGFSMFGRDKIYALDENMQLDTEGLCCKYNRNSLHDRSTVHIDRCSKRNGKRRYLL